MVNTSQTFDDRKVVSSVPLDQLHEIKNAGQAQAH